MKDLIKVNAYVAFVFVMMNIFQSVSVIGNPGILNDAMKQVTDLQNAQSPLPAGLIMKIMKGVIWFLLFYALTLGAHVSMTFRLLKQYAHLFGDKNVDDIHPTRID
jgi:hypothetical protein